MTSFQFSPVNTMNIVIKAVYVSPNAYLASSPPSSKGSAKNYLQKSEKMKRNKKIRIPRFVMSPIDPKTAPIKTLRESHDLMILKIRSRRAALSMPSPPPLSALGSFGTTSSIKLVVTMKASKRLKLS